MALRSITRVTSWENLNTVRRGWLDGPQRPSTLLYKDYRSTSDRYFDGNQVEGGASHGQPYVSGCAEGRRTTPILYPPRTGTITPKDCHSKSG
jgi:hypothetical protein